MCQSACPGIYEARQLIRSTCAALRTSVAEVLLHSALAEVSDGSSCAKHECSHGVSFSQSLRLLVHYHADCLLLCLLSAAVKSSLHQEVHGCPDQALKFSLFVSANTSAGLSSDTIAKGYFTA
jgi:hypothetical protein